MDNKRDLKTVILDEAELKKDFKTVVLDEEELQQVNQPINQQEGKSANIHLVQETVLIDENADETIASQTVSRVSQTVGIPLQEQSDDRNDESAFYSGVQDPRWLQPGTILENPKYGYRYRIEKVIGAGGFGITYKAYDEANNVYRAVKEFFQQGVVNRIPGTSEVLISAPKRKDEFEYGKERLLNEARMVAKFQSNGVVGVYDFFPANNTSYMVMEFIQSQTLEDFIINKQGKISIDDAITIGVNICEALEVIHASGIIHRDIAPDNIFIDDDLNIKIIDFGSSRLSKADIDDRLIIIKPGFAPPEQYEKIDLKNDKQQSWTDVYAVGAVLYYILTGIIPAESSDRKVDFNTNTDRVCYPKDLNPNVPDFLNNTIMTAMAINIHERFQNTTELKEALLQKRKVLSVEDRRRKRRFKRTVGILVSILVVALVSVFGIYRYEAKKRDVVLEAANIQIWYKLSADETLATQKDSAMNAIVEELAKSDVYADVAIELTGIPEADYQETIEAAYQSGTMPNIYEVDESVSRYSSETADVKNVISEVKDSDCYFISDYNNYFSDTQYIPIGFNIPVIYINQSMLTDFDKSNVDVKSMADYIGIDSNMQYMPISIKQELYENYKSMLADFNSYESLISGAGLEEFLNGDTVAYFSDTSDYFPIRSSLTGNVVIIPLHTDEVICTFSDLYAVYGSGGAEETAAKEVAGYLLSNFAQESYYIQTNLPGIPLEKIALTKYSTAVHKQFEDIVENIDDFTFDKE